MGKLGVISDETVRKILTRRPGRSSDSQITVFDSSGIAIQDLAVAGAIFESARQMGEVQTIDF